MAEKNKNNKDSQTGQVTPKNVFLKIVDRKSFFKPDEKSTLKLSVKANTSKKIVTSFISVTFERNSVF